MGMYDNQMYSPDIYGELLRKYQQQNPGLPQNALSSPTPTLSTMQGTNSPLINRAGQTPSSTGFDPWSIGMAAGQAVAPVGASILGRRREFPSGGGGSASLGATRGAEVPNVYAGRKNPVILALLAKYLGRR